MIIFLPCDWFIGSKISCQVACFSGGGDLIGCGVCQLWSCVTHLSLTSLLQKKLANSYWQNLVSSKVFARITLMTLTKTFMMIMTLTMTIEMKMTIIMTRTMQAMITTICHLPSPAWQIEGRLDGLRIFWIHFADWCRVTYQGHTSYCICFNIKM